MSSESKVPRWSRNEVLDVWKSLDTPGLWRQGVWVEQSFDHPNFVMLGEGFNDRRKVYVIIDMGVRRSVRWEQLPTGAAEGCRGFVRSVHIA